MKELQEMEPGDFIVHVDLELVSLAAWFVFLLVKAIRK